MKSFMLFDVDTHTTSRLFTRPRVEGIFPISLLLSNSLHNKNLKIFQERERERGREGEKERERIFQKSMLEFTGVHMIKVIFKLIKKNASISSFIWCYYFFCTSNSKIVSVKLFFIGDEQLIFQFLFFLL